jgi:porphobilinogen synthase
MTDGFDIIERPRRLRRTAPLRRMTRESHLDPGRFVLPMFYREGLTESTDISGMPGVQQHTLDGILRTTGQALESGVASIMLFAIPEVRDAVGSRACDVDGPLTVAVSAVKQEFGEDAVVIADLCLDEFTDHGHCGVLDQQGRVDNDATLGFYQRMGIVLADAGADLLGTSGMMDGQVGAVREALDAHRATEVGILAYAAKYASSAYGPFRNAVESALQGDRRTYQQDPANSREALREVRLDVKEGADIVMVKPALGYLDIVARTAEAVDVPVAAYVVSGELAMIEYAAASGAIDRKRSIAEALTNVTRAGAGIVCTYWATEAAQWIAQGELES